MTFRQQTVLLLGDRLYSLQASLSHLTRSVLHRCSQRHDISRLPNPHTDPRTKQFKPYAIGYFYVDLAEVQTKEGKLYLFVAIDRTSKVAYAEFRLHRIETSQRPSCAI